MSVDNTDGFYDSFVATFPSNTGEWVVADDDGATMPTDGSHVGVNVPCPVRLGWVLSAPAWKADSEQLLTQTARGG